MSGSRPSGSELPRSDRPLHTLTVLLPEPALDALVFDAEDRIVARGGVRSGLDEGIGPGTEPNRFTADLPRGLYVLRASRSGAFVDTPVRLDGPKTVTAEAPPIFSAASVPGAQTTHEYYTHPAWDLSHRPTAPERTWNGPAEARLLLFVRASEASAYDGADQFDGLRLCTTQGDTLTRFADADVERHQTGWSAYSAALSPGLLILEDSGTKPKGARPRQLPVPLWPGWQTQLYVMHSGRPLWEDIRIAAVAIHDLDSRGGRSPYDHHAEDVRAGLDVDAALLALQNGADLAAPRLIHAFLHNKFRNPVLGLLGAYLMLLRAHRGLAKAKRAELSQPAQAQAQAAPAEGAPVDLMRIVLENLSELLPQSADVAALRLMAEPWLGPPAVHAVEQLPLFRQGAEVLLAAAAVNPAWLPEGSLLDAVSDRLYADTVWTSWETLPLLSVAGVDPQAKEAASTTADWVEAAVVDAIVNAERRQTLMPPEALVRSIGVSPSAVRKAMGRLVARAVEPLAEGLLNETSPSSFIFESSTWAELARMVGFTEDAAPENVRTQPDAVAASAIDSGVDIERSSESEQKVRSDNLDAILHRWANRAALVLGAVESSRPVGKPHRAEVESRRRVSALVEGLTDDLLKAFERTIPRLTARELRVPREADGQVLELVRRNLAAFPAPGQFGYDPEFLGIPVPLPVPRPELRRELAMRLDDPTRYLLEFRHFSTCMHARRRLPVFAAANLGTVGKPDTQPKYRPQWSIDPRIAEDHQPDDSIFSSMLQRGHLAARDVVLWGKTASERSEADRHSFTLTNACPQLAKFNSSSGEWWKVERAIEESLAAAGKASLFAGPVFRADDQDYHDLLSDHSEANERTGIRIPTRFWMILAWVYQGELRRRAFVLDQRTKLRDALALHLQGDLHPAAFRGVLREDVSALLRGDTLGFHIDVETRVAESTVGKISRMTDLRF